jgi:hypothetical protein
MRLSGPSSAALLILLFFLFPASTLFAQHGGGGGGGSSGGGSGSSGGHSGGGGGAPSSAHGGGSYGSGASAPRGSSSHGSSSHGVSGRGNNPSAPPSNSQRIQNLTRVPVLEAVEKAPQKRDLASVLLRPFRKAQQERVSEFQHRVCWRGACRICPVAQVPGAGGCTTPNLYLQNTSLCTHAEIWAGGPCTLQIHVLDDCSGLRMAMERQARRMQAAEEARQNGCSNAASQECTNLTSWTQKETSLYQTLQQRFNQCQARSQRSQLYRNNLFPSHDFRDFGVDMDRP